MAVKIVTDSCISVESDVVEKLGITIIPLSVLVDGVLYSDADLKPGQFLALMKASEQLPKTSQPPVGVFAEAYGDLGMTGDAIISIHTSHALSGTVEAARQGALLSQKDVTVVDSAFTDQALKFQVVAAAEMAQKGATKDEILATLDDIQAKSQLFIGVSSLENLVKGGRVNRVSGFLSSLLNIKVVMEMQNHALNPVLKGRGRKVFDNFISDLLETLKGREVAEIGISYAGSPEFALGLKERLAPFVSREISVLETGSIVQTHTGEGAWAVMIRYV